MLKARAWGDSEAQLCSFLLCSLSFFAPHHSVHTHTQFFPNLFYLNFLRSKELRMFKCDPMDRSISSLPSLYPLNPSS